MIIPYSTDSLDQIAETVNRGGILAFRTDTFYGLGVDPFNREAVRKIKELKGRDDQKPILIVISDRDQENRFIIEPSAAFDRLAKEFWPGPLTLIGRAHPDLSEEITAGTQTVGVRLPNDDRARLVARACGGALTATSANPSNAAPAANAQAVDGYFGDAVDLIVDGGKSETDRPSTVVDVSGADAKLVREGVFPWSQLMSVV